MDFSLSDEQRQIQEATQRLLADRYGSEARSRYAATPEGYGREMWAAYAEQGLLGVPFAESLGGLGGGPLEVMLVMEAFGRALALEPYLATVVLGGGLLSRAGNEAQRALLARIAAGVLTLAVATLEPDSSGAPCDVGTRARRSERGWVIDGAKTLVAHGGGADRLIVPARVSGERADTDGIALFLLDAQAPGLSRHDYATQDGLRAADLVLNGVRADDADVLGHGRRRRRCPRARDRRGDRGAVRRSGGRDVRATGDDARVSQDAPAVRGRDRAVPGTAAPRGGDVCGPRTGAQHGAVRRAQRERRPSRRAAARACAPPRRTSDAPRATSVRKPSSCTAGWA